MVLIIQNLKKVYKINRNTQCVEINNKERKSL